MVIILMWMSEADLETAFKDRKCTFSYTYEISSSIVEISHCWHLSFSKVEEKEEKGEMVPTKLKNCTQKNNRCRLLFLPKQPKDSIECIKNDKKWHLFRKFQTFSSISQAVILAQILLPLAYSIINISLTLTLEKTRI